MSDQLVVLSEFDLTLSIVVYFALVPTFKFTVVHSLLNFRGRSGINVTFLHGIFRETSAYRLPQNATILSLFQLCFGVS